MAKITAPFTEEQVAALNKWQAAGFVHPYTCDRVAPECEVRGRGDDYSKDGILLATPAGLICPCGKYLQTWAHDFVADVDELNIILKPKQ